MLWWRTDESPIRIHMSRIKRPPARRFRSVMRTERLRFDSIWLPETMLTGSFDPLVALSHVAALTERLKIGSHLILPGRAPVRLAEN